MALEATFRDLTVCLHHLHDALNALQVTLGDKPEDDESALADGVETVVLDLMGHIARGAKSGAERAQGGGSSGGSGPTRRALTSCQDRFHRIEQQFATDLLAYAKLKELARLGKERRAWLPWSTTVKRGIEQCQPPLEQSSAALAACWQELAERLGTMNISVQSTNVGQQITMPRSRTEDLEAEGVT